MSDEAIVRTNGRVLFMQGQAGKQVVITSDDDTVSIDHTSTSTKDTWDLSVPEQEVNWGDIGGTLSNQTDLNNKLTDLSEDILDEVEDRENADAALSTRIDGKQDKLTAGDHIEITDDNTINVVGEFGKVYEGVSPVNVDNTNDTISVDHVELNVASPITWDSTTHTIGFNDNGFAKTSDIPTDFYTTSEVDSKDASLGNRITANEGNISTNTSNISTLNGKMTTVEGDITTINGKFDSYYTKTQIDGFLSNWSGFVVIPLGQELPAASEAQLGKIYLWKKADAQEKDNYEEWISDGTAWSKIGSMEVDLSNYYTKTEVEQNFATLGDITRVEAAVNDKISTVEVDGVTITGNGVDIPLKATAALSDGYTLEAETAHGAGDIQYINITDDTTNKKTVIGLSAAAKQAITAGVNKQDKLTASTGIDITGNTISCTVPKVVSWSGADRVIVPAGKKWTGTLSIILKPSTAKGAGTYCGPRHPDNNIAMLVVWPEITESMVSEYLWFCQTIAFEYDNRNNTEDKGWDFSRSGVLATEISTTFNGIEE